MLGGGVWETLRGGPRSQWITKGGRESTTTDTLDGTKYPQAGSTPARPNLTWAAGRQ